MRKFIIANLKANPDSPGRAVALVKKIVHGLPRSKDVEVVICPPFTFLSDIRHLISDIRLGAQDVFWGDVGPYTGEVSWRQLKHLGVSYVIVGHSERRRLLGETDEMINKKVLASLRAGLKVILCVGEPEARGKRKEERGKYAREYVRKQLKKDLKYTRPLSSILCPLLTVAYEPIWSISTSRGKLRDHSDTPENAAEMTSYIKKLLTTHCSLLTPRVLYGGSVNARNARSFLSRGEIDGALVGAASLKPAEFAKIVEAAK